MQVDNFTLGTMNAQMLTLRCFMTSGKCAIDKSMVCFRYIHTIFRFVHTKFWWNSGGLLKYGSKTCCPLGYTGALRRSATDGRRGKIPGRDPKFLFCEKYERPNRKLTHQNFSLNKEVWRLWYKAVKRGASASWCYGGYTFKKRPTPEIASRWRGCVRPTYTPFLAGYIALEGENGHKKKFSIRKAVGERTHYWADDHYCYE